MEAMISTPSADSFPIVHAWLLQPRKSATVCSNKWSRVPKKREKELIERHVRLVASIALKFRLSNVDMEDIMAEGIQGLVVAMDKFDHTRGIKLSTYAAWWIRQRIQRLIGKMSGAVAVPHDVSQGKRKESLVRTQLQVELGRMPTDEEVKTAWDRIETSPIASSMPPPVHFP